MKTRLHNDSNTRLTPEEEGELSGYNPEDSELLTPEEEGELSGYNPESSELIDKEYLFQREGEQPEERDSSENPAIRAVFALLIMGGIMLLGWGIWQIFFAPKPLPPRTAAKSSPLPTPSPENDEKGRLLAELALREQASRQELSSKTPKPAKSSPSPTPSPTPSPKPSPNTSPSPPASSEPPPPPPQIIREAAPPPKIIREPAPPPQIIREPAPASPSLPPPTKAPSPPPTNPQPTLSPPQPPVVEKPEPIDPFEEWSKQAHLGEKRSDNNSSNNVAASEKAEDGDRSVGSDRETRPLETQTLQPVPDRSIAVVEATPLQPMLSTPGQTPTLQSSQVRGALPVQTVVASVQELSQPVNSEDLPQIATITLGDGSSPSIPGTETAMSPGEIGILTRSSQFTTENVRTNEEALLAKEIAIGTSVAARVLVPTIWSAENESPTVQRFAVELIEDAIATNGAVALPAGTILITEITSVAPANQMIEQTAVALAYRSSSGATVQVAVPRNAIIIRGENNEPLIAKKINQDRGGIVARDILVGTLNGLSRVGEIINQPDEEFFRTDSGVFGSSLERRTTRRSPNLPAAFAQAFFGTTGSRLAKRTDQITQEILNRPKTLFVAEGTEVSVFFNSIVRVK